MTLKDDIDAYADSSEDRLMTADGLDDAIIGIISIVGYADRVVYDQEKVIDVLITQQGMDPGEAQDHYDFNIARAYANEIDEDGNPTGPDRTPAFFWKP